MANLLEERRVPYAFPINVKHVLETPLERGMLVSVGALDTQEFDVYNVDALAANKRVAMITEVAINYDDHKQENEMTLPKGVVGKANYLQKGEIYTIAKTLVPATPAIGNLLKPGVSGHAWIAATDLTDAVAEIVNVINYEGQDSVWIEILK